MELTIRQHIDRIQGRMNALNSQLMDTCSRHDANHVESEIRALRLAQTHFQLALQIAMSFEAQGTAA